MSLFSNIPKEKGTQLYFRDDGSFIFRKLDIEDSFLVEKKNTEILKAWMLKYNLLIRFDGCKGISSGMVTISYGRDILFDPFDVLKLDEKPDKGESLQKTFVKNIAEAKCYRHEQKATGNGMVDKIVIFMGSAIVLLAVAIGIAVAF